MWGWNPEVWNFWGLESSVPGLFAPLDHVPMNCLPLGFCPLNNVPPWTVHPSAIHPWTICPQTVCSFAIAPLPPSPRLFTLDWTSHPWTICPHAICPQTIHHTVHQPQTICSWTIHPWTICPMTTFPQAIYKTFQPQAFHTQTLCPRCSHTLTTYPHWTIGPQVIHPQHLLAPNCLPLDHLPPDCSSGGEWSISSDLWHVLAEWATGQRINIFTSCHVHRIWDNTRQNNASMWHYDQHKSLINVVFCLHTRRNSWASSVSRNTFEDIWSVQYETYILNFLSWKHKESYHKRLLLF